MDEVNRRDLLVADDYRRYMKNAKRLVNAARALLGALQGRDQYVYMPRESAGRKSIMEEVCDLADQCGVAVEVVNTGALRIGGAVCVEISVKAPEAHTVEFHSATTDALGNIIQAEINRGL